MNPMGCETTPDARVARLIDANLDRAREGLRVVEDWCRFGLEQHDLVVQLKDYRQRLGRLHKSVYKQARSTASDTGAGLKHSAQMERTTVDQVVAANCARVQEALRVLEEYGRSIDPALATEAAVIRYALYDIEVTCLQASERSRRSAQLHACSICLITSDSDDLIERVRPALINGVGMVQYRSKNAEDRVRLEQALALRSLCDTHGALLIINDRIDIALAVDADGVHLGQDDLPIAMARSLIGGDRLIGLSTHTLEQVRDTDSQSCDCDYLGLGPVHSTAVKPDRQPIGAALVGEALALTSLPLFAIGGIHADNLESLVKEGCRHIAVIGAIMNADDPALATQHLLQQLTKPASEPERR